MKAPKFKAGEAMDDYFEILQDCIEDWKYGKLSKAPVPEKKLYTYDKTHRDVKRGKKEEGEKEASRAVQIKDLFTAMDLNNNGKLSQSEFVRGMQQFGYDGDSEMLATIFHELDEAK